MKVIAYNFKPTYFAEENTIVKQITHIASELNEVAWELVTDNGQGTLMEAIDVYHSAETLLRVLVKAFGEGRVLDAMNQTAKKNDDRGYYIERAGNGIG